MMDINSLRVKASEVKAFLEDFEQFCLGRKHLSPQQFSALNEELSLSAVLNIGSNRLEKKEDGNHLIWVAPDASEHDLGALENINLRDYPGFHRTRSLSLGQSDVEMNDLVHVPNADRHITMVKMKDGSVGYGPNYKLALRNAALKMHLKREFKKANPLHFWKLFYGNA